MPLPPSWCSDALVSMREASIGQSVSATTQDSSTDMASTKPNSRNRPPVWPGRKEIGTKTATSVSRRGDDGEEHLLRAEHGGGARTHALVAPPHDVFQHDDGVVDDQARRQHQRQQRQDVDREAGEIDRGDRADHARPAWRGPE